MATLKSWMTSVIRGKLVLGERQETATRVMVEAANGLQRIEQAYMGDASIRGMDQYRAEICETWQPKSKVQYFRHAEAQQ
jgi:hypothetical protein